MIHTYIHLRTKLLPNCCIFFPQHQKPLHPVTLATGCKNGNRPGLFEGQVCHWRQVFGIQLAATPVGASCEPSRAM